MAKRSDINLIPTELRQQRKTEEVRKSFNLIGLGVFTILSVVSLLFFVFRLKLRDDFQAQEKSVNRELEKINDLSSVEQDAKRLKIKYDAVSKVFKNQNNFSVLLDNLAESTPKDVTISNFATVGENKVGINGNAQSYVSLANFILTALDPTFGGKIFNGADLTSVSLDDVNGRVKFTLVFYLKSAVLMKEK